MNDFTRRLAVRIVSTWQRTRSDRGASLVEYALLVSLIAVVCIGAVTLLGGNTNTTLSSAATSI